MSKVIGTGETVTDFIIRNGKPEDMVCGGSCYNSMISIGRCGVEAYFVGEVGDDKLGLRTRQMLEDNGVSADYLVMTKGKKSQLSLAFLNERNDAEYVFYKDHASDIFPTALPQPKRGDVLLYGSFFAINPIIHPALSDYVGKAKEKGCTVYYDINFRTSHMADKDAVMPHVIDNLKKASIVKGSDEDFLNLFGLSNAADIYNKISKYCPTLIITRGSKEVSLITPTLRKDYAVGKTEVVSTVGAGDNFNAGIVCGLIANGTDAACIGALPEQAWDRLIATATQFAQEVCGTTRNYISADSGRRFRSENTR